MKKTQIFRFARMLVLVAVTLMTARSTQAATDYFTNTPYGQFTGNNNWSPNTAPINAGDVAIITNGATVYLTNAESVLNLGSLLLTNKGGGVLTMSNSTTGGTTTLTVSNVVVGGAGSTTNARLNVFGGNFTNLLLGGANFAIGNTAGSTGAVVIAGSSATANFVSTNLATLANLYVGNAGLGTLTVSNGASVYLGTNVNLNIGAGSGANGSAAYLGGLGTASTITLNGNNSGASGIIIGQSGSSSNALVITNATVNVTGSQENFYLGYNNSASTVAYNACYVSNNATFNFNGIANTIVGMTPNSGNANSNTWVIGAGGVVTNAGGGKNSLGVVVGGAYTGGGTTIGNQLAINNGGKFYSASSGSKMTIGGAGNAAATLSSGNSVLVTDSGSLLSVPNGVFIGSAFFNSPFSAPLMTNNFLIVTNGAQVVSGAASAIGNMTNANYNYALITGAGSLWNLSGYSLTIGGYSATTNNWLTLTNGGLLTNVTSVILGGVSNNIYFNNGKLAAGASGTLIATNATTVNCFAYVQSGGATIDSSTFTVTNTVQLTQDPNSTGGGLTKLGTGTLVLSTSNSYTGGTTISNGLVNAAANNALGTGLITLAGGSLTNTVSATLTNAVNLISASTNGVAVGNTLTLGGVITNTGNLTASGPGTLNLTNANNAIGGTTTVTGGTLGMNGTNIGPVSITASGALLPGGLGTIGTLTITTNLTLSGGNSLFFNIQSTSSYDQIVVGGTNVVNNTNYLQLNGSLAAGTYYLITNNFTKQGSGVIVFAGNGTTNLTVGGLTLTLTNGANSVVLGVAGSGTVGVTNLTWKGYQSGTWDLATTPNWNNGAPAVYTEGAFVTFDDTANNFNVTNNAGYSPAPGAVFFVNNTYNYTNALAIQGSGAVTLNGGKNVTLTGTNTYTGTTILNGGGVLQVGNGAGSGNIPTNIVINAGSLAYNLTNNYTQAGTIACTNIFSSITNVATLAGSSNILTFADGFNNFSNIINKSGTLVLNGSANSTNIVSTNGANPMIVASSGTINIAGGYWFEGFDSANAGNITVSGGGTLNIGLMRNGYGNFTVNNGNLLVETAANDSGNNSHFDFGAGASSNTTNSITLSSGLVDVYSDSFVIALAAGTAGTGSGVTTTAFIQSGGTARFGVTPGPSTAIRNLTIADNGLTTNELVYYSLSGGKVLVYGTLASGTNGPGSATIPTQTGFDWTGGQLSAGTITCAYFNQPNNNNSILNNILTNSAGTLAPGDTNIAGLTTINGSYVQTSGGTLDIDVDGTNVATGFQSGAGYYDRLVVTNQTILNGTLLVRTNTSLTGVTATSKFVIVTNYVANNLTASFNNVYNGRVGITSTNGGNGASFVVLTNGNTVVLTNYAALVAGFTVGNFSAPAGSTVTFANNNAVGAITNWIVYYGDGGAYTNVITAGNSIPSGTLTTHQYAAGSYTATNVVIASDGSTAQTTQAISATGNPTLAWLGTATANWNASDLNWTNLTSGGTTTAYADGDPVIFDELGSAQPTVNLASSVVPASVSFSNSVTTYTLQGAGKITSTASLVKSLAGTTIILTTNDYNGGTIINGGTLQVGNGTVSGSLGSGGITDNGALVYNVPDSPTVSQAISGNGPLTKAGAGTLALPNANSYSGGTLLFGGTISISNAAALGTIGTIEFTNSATLQWGGSVTADLSARLKVDDNSTATIDTTGNSVTLASAIATGTTGNGALSKAGSGTLTLTASNTFTGLISVGAGTLQIGNAGGAGLRTNAFALTSGTTLQFNTTNSLTIWTVDGAGATLNNNNTTGVLTLNPGAGNHTIGTIGGVSGATVILAGSATSTNTVSNVFNTAGMLIKITNGIWTRAGAGSHTVNTEIDGGVFNVTNGDFQLRQGGQTFTVHGGQMNLSNAYGWRVGNIYGANNNNVPSSVICVQDGGTIYQQTTSAFDLGNPVNGYTNSYTLSGGTFTIASGGMNLGAGTNNSLTTFTLTNGGKLSVNGTIAGYQGSTAQQVFAFNGGTLVAGTINASQLSGSAAPTVQGTFYNTGGKLAPGDVGTPGLTTIEGNYVQGSGGVLAIDIGGTTNASAFTNSGGYYDMVAVTTNATLGGSLSVSLINSFVPATTNSFTILTNGGTLSMAFTNLTAGNRVALVGNPNATFLVVTTATKVILTNYAVAVTTTNALTSSVNPSVYGQSVTFTATLMTNGVTAGNATGNYVFYVDNSPVATNGVTSGSASYSTSGLTVAGSPHPIQVVYLGDPNYLTSTNSLTQTVNQGTPVVSTALSATAITYGQALTNSTLSGTFTNLAGVTVPGTLTFLQPAFVPSAPSTNASVVFTPTDATDYQSVTNLVLVNVNQAASGLTLTSSSPTNGYLDPAGVYFTAIVPTNATGSVIFLATNDSFGEVISTNGITNGQAISLTITNLPRGTNVITAQYAGDGNYLGSTNTLNQYVTNHPPMAAVLTVTGSTGQALAISLADVATNWTDADGDPIYLTTVNLTTTNGVNLMVSNYIYTTNWVFTNGFAYQTNSTPVGSLVSIVTNSWLYVVYTNGPLAADQLSYSIADGQGGTNVGYINIVLSTGGVTGTNSIASYNFTNGVPFTLTAYGVIGESYETQRSTNLTDWVPVVTNTAATNGVISISDSFSDLGSNAPSPLFYRLRWVPKP